MTKRNAMSAWIQAFIKNQPEASSAEAWRCLTQTAVRHDVFDWLLGYDPKTGAITYRPGPGSDARTIGRDSFSKQHRRSRVLAGFGNPQKKRPYHWVV